MRKSLDATSYVIRFSPRRPKSIWSDVNIRRVEALMKLGLMQPSGLTAFGERKESSSRRYSYENTRALDEPYAVRLRSNPKAWDYFQSSPPSYRRAASWWVMSAKKEETRQKRLETLIQDSERGMKIEVLRRLDRKKQDR